ncbi:MAG: 50S ribosomal protein L18 [Candidatus Accumulibacter sp.]|uniref:50S ribosomal protein L18 n=1 Tax=Accumulibacter sp. TaxID=2053492 RepID=UPI0019DBF8EB|nr:50S ribosomal protein L18 [Accumulibacter sp.]MBE2260889.1 50S ribosomal protein L18 [Paracoccaceae bacterium]MCB1941612.1 50S ribosomal protein L18 [Accumulibacter sp.]MCP5248642.1 50S ribosomal protein L18 [Accumulibacter sp.]
MDKKQARLRRARKTRAKIAELKTVRLSVHRSNCHIYAQVISACGAKVLAAASSLELEVRKSLPKGGGDIGAAKAIGQLVAERARKAGIEQVAFDRSGFQYHGRIKALAEAAREAGLKF